MQKGRAFSEFCVCDLVFFFVTNTPFRKFRTGWSWGGGAGCGGSHRFKFMFMAIIIVVIGCLLFSITPSIFECSPKSLYTVHAKLSIYPRRPLFSELLLILLLWHKFCIRWIDAPYQKRLFVTNTGANLNYLSQIACSVFELNRGGKIMFLLSKERGQKGGWIMDRAVRYFGSPADHHLL